MTTRYFGHSAPRLEDWEPLSLHIRRVAKRARRNAAAFDAADEAEFMALLHDLGKYSNLFTQRLRGETNGLDHWSIGAWAAWQHLGRHGAAAALAIEGHHIGLQKGFTVSRTTKRIDPAWLTDGARDGRRWTETDVDRALERLAEDGFMLPSVHDSFAAHHRNRVAHMTTTRLLFSALVDADFIATEKHFKAFEPEGVRRRLGISLDAKRAYQVVREHIDHLATRSRSAPPVNALRTRLLDDCLAAGERDRGAFTLTAPTGTGKTLAMLAFALRHAHVNNQRRVIFVIPYLSILEQTAAIYRDLFAPVFGDAFVLEHHSLAERGHNGAGDEQDQTAAQARMLTENWDAPLVITTNVQLLESLFAHRTSRCRKLHNLAKSVILFDEAQTLPLQLALPTLGALHALVATAGASVVFATATQPAFDHLDDAVRRYPNQDRPAPEGALGWRPAEMVTDPPSLFAAAKRVDVVWETRKPVTWNALADRMLTASTQALAVVNLKQHASELFEALKARGAEGLFHLSTNLCPAHRTALLDAVRDRLTTDKPCLLVSTQCIEAGVDVDFPRVYRALGPLDAIAQAAGRCNRNGHAKGLVVVFRPDVSGSVYPPGFYGVAANVTAAQLAKSKYLDIDDPATFRRYYQELYQLSGLDAADQADPLADAIRTLDFPGVDKHYRVIDQNTINVVVPYDPKRFMRLREQLDEVGHLHRSWIRAARALAVGVYRPTPGAWPAGLGEVKTRGGEDASDWFLLTEPDQYHPQLGLKLESNLWIA